MIVGKPLEEVVGKVSHTRRQSPVTFSEDRFLAIDADEAVLVDVVGTGEDEIR